MTVVAVKKEKKYIHLVCDTEVSYSWGNKQSTSFGNNVKDFSKIYNINDIYFGCAGAVEDLLVMKQYVSLNNPKGNRLDDMEDYILGLYKHFKDRKSDRKGNFQTIIIYKGKIFSAWDYMIYEVGQYDAIGSGMYHAKTTMYLGYDAKKSVKVSIELSQGVGGDIHEYKIPY